MCLYCVSKMHSSATWARFLGRGPVKGRLLHEADSTLGQACSIQVRIFRRSPRAHSRDRSPRTSCLGRPGSASSSSSRFQLIRRIHPQTPSIQKKSHHLICLSPIARPDSRFREDSSSCRKEDKPSAHEFISIWLYTSW
jgi:hypothetical protein